MGLETGISGVPQSPKTERFELSNGMGVMVCSLPGLHRVSLLLNVLSGCRHERLAGTAHMLEHLMFRGSKSHPSLRALSEAFEAWGADFNAYTAREVTSFDVSMPVGSLEPVLGLLGEAMLSPRLTGIASERDIVREEILGDYDSDGELINAEDLLIKLFYGDAGRPIAGDPSDLDKISKQEVLSFYKAHYFASNMLLVLAGPFEGDLRPMLEASFGGLPAAGEKWRMRSVPACLVDALSGRATCGPRLVVRRYDGATQSEVMFGFMTGPATGKSFAPLEMLVRILDDGMSSRLSRRLVEELALVYDAESYISTTCESSLMQVRVSCRHRRVARLVEAVYGLLFEICGNPVGDEELDRIRRRAVWEHEGLLDNTASYAQWVSTMEMQGLPSDISSRCHRLLAVSADDICQIARDLLNGLQMVVIVGDLGERASGEVREVMSKMLGRDVDLTLM